MDCSPPGSSVHGISQAGVLEWGAISYSRGWPLPPSTICLALPGSSSHPPHTWGLLISRYRPSSSPDPREQGNQAVTLCILKFLSKAFGFSTDPAPKCSDSIPSPLGPTCMTVQIGDVLSILGVRPFAGHKGCRDGSTQAIAGSETTGVTSTSSKQTMPAQQFLTRQRSAKGGPRGEPHSTAGGSQMSRRNPRSRGSESDKSAMWGHQDQGD